MSEVQSVGVSPWTLVSAEEMRALDVYSIETLGIDADLLMESAGRAVCEEVIRVLSALGLGREGRILVLCGGGNNGGDGLVVARHLHQLGFIVQVLIATPVASLRGDAAANAQRAQRVGLELQPWGSGADRARRLAGADVVVDAIFGTGLSRRVEGDIAECIEQVNELSEGAVVVAVDLPSGLNADTGACLGPTIRATHTVTLGSPKLGLMLEPGRSLAGEIRVARIGIAERSPECQPKAVCWSPAWAGLQLPDRPRTGHKGRFGHALVIAGSRGKTGAAALTAQGAARAGAGLVTVACAESLNAILEVKCTEMMTVPVAEHPDQSISPEAEKVLLELASVMRCVALGPGLGQNPGTQALVARLVEKLSLPIVVDADGLNALVGNLDLLHGRSAPTVLTPHPGEAARLLDSDPVRINTDRVASACLLAQRTGAIVLLKGAGTVIATPEGDVVLNPTGGPALASGGTGDLLTGLVAGFVCQGLDVFDAAALAAYVHGAASDRCAKAQGEAGLMAGDLAATIPRTMQELREASRTSCLVPGLVIPFP